MTILQSIKPFWPLIFTFILPRALGYFQALKTSVRTRPPPRPLTDKASRGLNVLFVAIFVFLLLSTAGSDQDLNNVFRRTKTRLQVPTDLLFSRLTSLRKNGLTNDLEILKSKITTLPMRHLYLRYGPHTIISCPFCHPDEPLTYALHHLPTNILFPHLLNLLATGLSTSRSISGPGPSHFRIKSTLAAIAFLLLDITVTTLIDFPINPTTPSPTSLYSNLIILRPLLLAIYNILLAFVIYASTTGRFIFFPFLASATATDQTDMEELTAKSQKLLADTNLSLQMTQMKLRGLNVTKNAVVRDELLKGVDDRYWEQVRRMEIEGGLKEGSVDQSVFEDEEVQGAVARAFGSGNVDVARMRKEAEGFVREVTRGLDVRRT